MSSLIKPGMDPATPEQPAPAELPERESARRRLERKRKFYGDLVAYVVINAFLIVVWAVSGDGYFWPGWVAGGWGVLLLLDAWSLYYRRPITEADVDRELQQRR
ncbi:MAG TPA: 2TM domain-containing protein [Jatrophihabitans sp.]|jgi:hypothetical protein|nr:2TM domain-containing protein [Jatrophihabitans sp.]